MFWPAPSQLVQQTGVHRGACDDDQPACGERRPRMQICLQSNPGLQLHFGTNNTRVSAAAADILAGQTMLSRAQRIDTDFTENMTSTKSLRGHEPNGSSHELLFQGRICCKLSMVGDRARLSREHTVSESGPKPNQNSPRRTYPSKSFALKLPTGRARG
jgi:hypothetical protein